ncbi:hypothetical protein [Pseudomonas aeruginosa]|uniref:hypothetical protein n=1 Tax=Pseudomonas aeruginosa TaxID=287 RepID=UPI001F36D880|nr:hypothetical protein [Pseudomonas aeruginosa]
MIGCQPEPIENRQAFGGLRGKQLQPVVGAACQETAPERAEAAVLVVQHDLVAGLEVRRQ